MPDDQILGLYEKGSYEIRPLDNMRKTIAARLTMAAVTIPHFRLTIDCEIDALLDARERLNARSPKDGPNAYKLSVNDFLIKAMGLALQRVPEANATRHRARKGPPAKPAYDRSRIVLDRPKIKIASRDFH